MVQEENYLEIPEFCPPAVYAQMVECFNANPGRRPNFGELHSKFQVIFPINLKCFNFPKLFRNGANLANHLPFTCNNIEQVQCIRVDRVVE